MNDKKSIDELLNDELENYISNLDYLDYGSKEMASAVEDVTKLLKAVSEREKLATDFMFDNNNRLISKEQLEEQKIDRKVRIGITAGELLIPLIFYGIWMRKGFKFEEKGVYSSTTFRGLFSRFRPTKK